MGGVGGRQATKKWVSGMVGSLLARTGAADYNSNRRIDFGSTLPPPLFRRGRSRGFRSRRTQGGRRRGLSDRDFLWSRGGPLSGAGRGTAPRREGPLARKPPSPHRPVIRLRCI